MHLIATLERHAVKVRDARVSRWAAHPQADRRAPGGNRKVDSDLGVRGPRHAGGRRGDVGVVGEIAYPIAARIGAVAARPHRPGIVPVFLYRHGLRESRQGIRSRRQLGGVAADFDKHRLVVYRAIG